MKEFTSTELRIKSSDVYNEVHKTGIVVVKHRDRPEMVLVTREYFEDRAKMASMALS